MTNFRVCLAPLNEGDIPIIVHWLQDAEFRRLYNAHPDYPHDETAITQRIKKQLGADNQFHFGIRLTENNELVGTVSLDGIDRSNPHKVGWVDIGIGDKTDWGKGYGTEAMRLVLDYAFSELKLDRIQLAVFSHNQRAIALYEKLGFQRYRVNSGKPHDVYMYSLVPTDWSGQDS